MSVLFYDLNNILWILVIVLMIFIGSYLTIKLSGIQFKLFKMIRLIMKNNSGEINAFKALMFALAGKIGVGSISGIALAIYLAGPGIIFWVWIISILTIPIVYAEVYLAMKYRDKYSGGTAYYLKDGLNNYKLGLVYSILIIFCSTFGFISIQANTITKSITTYFNINS